MSNSGRYVTRYSVELNAVQVFDPESALLNDSDAICLGDTLSELMDEMGRYGFNAASAPFTIDRERDVSRNLDDLIAEAERRLPRQLTPEQETRFYLRSTDTSGPDPE
jgi:hypothetical protein